MTRFGINPILTELTQDLLSLLFVVHMQAPGDSASMPVSGPQTRDETEKLAIDLDRHYAGMNAVQRPVFSVVPYTRQAWRVDLIRRLTQLPPEYRRRAGPLEPETCAKLLQAFVDELET